jgi:hypothetical protein
MAVTTDHFTAANGTLLSAHATPEGYNWSESFNASGVELTVQTNELVAPAANTAPANYRLLTPTLGVFTTDSVETISWRRTGAPSVGGEGNVSLYSRFSGGGISGADYGGYEARIALSGATPTVSLVRNSDSFAGVTFLSLASCPLPGGLDTLTHTLRLETHGTTFIVFLDGARALTAIDTSFSTGYLGIGGLGDNVRLDEYIAAASGYSTTLQALTTMFWTLHGPSMPIPAPVFAFLTAPHRPKSGTLALGGSGGTPVPIDGQLWPRGQKSG